MLGGESIARGKPAGCSQQERAAICGTRCYRQITSTTEGPTAALRPERPRKISYYVGTKIDSLCAGDSGGRGARRRYVGSDGETQFGYFSWQTLGSTRVGRWIGGIPSDRRSRAEGSRESRSDSLRLYDAARCRRRNHCANFPQKTDVNLRGIISGASWR